jgi:hypothetical protein
MGVVDRLILRDDQWERMARHVIGDERTRGSSGRDNRMFVEAVLWIVRTKRWLGEFGQRDEWIAGLRAARMAAAQEA